MCLVLSWGCWGGVLTLQGGGRCLAELRLPEIVAIV